MKSVKRYDGKIEHCDNGGYVTFADYKKLEARLENATGREMKLKSLIAEQQAVIDQRNGECDRLINELATLRANIKLAESYPDDADLKFTIDWYDDERSDGLQMAMWLKELRRRREQAAPVAVPLELLAAMEEVIRISDRDHEAWYRAKAAIEVLRLNSGGKGDE